MKHIDKVLWETAQRDIRHALRMGASRTEYLQSIRTYNQSVRLHIPLGELDNLAGFAWVWKQKGRMSAPQPLTGNERLKAQGLEGKVTVDMSLYDAVIVASQADPHRLAIEPL